ncbi:MAG: hypothetical protein M3P83_00015 [Actinomycetota bacterium]|nr:hypothetical protein [Actinomycetota bacterium]
MTARVYVHVGPHKTGTTFLQQTLATNKDALAAAGVLFPGRDYADHLAAVLDALGRGVPGDRRRVRGRWAAVAEEVRAWPGGTAVLSAEALAGAGAAGIERLVTSLQPAQVHVVYTARDLTRVIPAMWQTHMRSRVSEPWPGYLASVRGDAGADPKWGERLWNTQDPRRVFARWERHVPRERIHVVTVPPSGADPGVLWERFCSLVGVDPTAYPLTQGRANTSLGTAESEVLRRVNAKVAGRLRDGSYHRWVNEFTTRRVLKKRPGQTRFALPAEEHGWVRERAEQVIAFLEADGYDVVGDLADLLPAPPSPDAAAPDDVDLDRALDAAADVVAALLRQLEAATGPPERTGVRSSSAAVARRVRSTAAAALGRRSGRPARWRSRR